MASILIRGLLVAAALVVAAWLAFSLRAVDLQTDAEGRLDDVRRGGTGASDVEQIRTTLHRADRNNPDLAPLLDEGLLLFYAGRRTDAFAVASRAVAKEPDNAQAWTLSYLSAPNPAAAAAAKARVQRLNPWLGDTLR